MLWEVKGTQQWRMWWKKKTCSIIFSTWRDRSNSKFKHVNMCQHKVSVKHLLTSVTRLMFTKFFVHYYKGRASLANLWFYWMVGTSRLWLLFYVVAVQVLLVNISFFWGGMLAKAQEHHQCPKFDICLLGNKLFYHWCCISVQHFKCWSIV